MSKERRQALRNHHTSTYGKTYSTTKSFTLHEDEDGNVEGGTSKSQKSSLSHQSSSDEIEGRDKLDMKDGRGTAASRRNVPSRISANYSTTKSSNHNATGNGTGGSRRSCTSAARKYSPVVVGDHDDYDDEDDYIDNLVDCVGNGTGGGSGGASTNSSGGGTSSSDADDYIPVNIRRTSSRGLFRSGSSNLTLNDFVRNPWKGTTSGDREEGGSSSEEISATQNGNSSPTPPARKLSSGYAIPVDSLLRPNQHRQHLHGKRPESWNSSASTGQQQTNLFYRTPSIVPSQWINKRELPLARSVGPPFGRSTMIVCPSRLTAEVTYIRRM